jgi:divinyl protochlorophyllide a 8-vinyl-reductase
MRTLALDAAAECADSDYEPSARIGPNAIIQLGIVVGDRFGEDARREIFRSAGLTGYLKALPDAMVDEAEVIALHRALRAVASAELCRAVSWEAGLLTGDYILANRIPKPAQVVLKFLPRPLAAKALTAAIGKHSWTFAGSGIFRAVSTNPLVLQISESPLCRGEHAADPICDYYSGTFTRLYRSLVDSRITIVETACGAVDGGPCRFEEVAAVTLAKAELGQPGA